MKPLQRIVERLASSLGREQAHAHVRLAYEHLIRELALRLPPDQRTSFLTFCTEEDITRAELDALAAEQPGSEDPEPTGIFESPPCVCGHYFSAHATVYESDRVGRDGVIDLAAKSGLALCGVQGCQGCTRTGFRLR